MILLILHNQRQLIQQSHRLQHHPKQRKRVNRKNHVSKPNKHSERDQRVLTRVFYASNRSNNSRNPSSEQPKKSIYPPRFFHNQPIDLDCSDNAVLAR